MINTKKTTSNMKKKVVSICLILGIGALTFTGAHIVKRENGYKSFAKEFVEATYEDDNSLYLGYNNNGFLLPDYNESTLITRGKYLKNEIEQKGILYCELLDEYYTETGSPIAIIDTFLNGGKTVYRRIEVLDNLEEPLFVEDNECIVILDTKPYSDLIDMNLVVEMPSKVQFIDANQEMYQGELALRKK